MIVNMKLACCFVLLLSAAVDGTSHSSECVPQFGKESRIVTVAKSGDGLATPRDLQFHPATGELWIASADEGGVGSGNYIIRNPGTVQQETSLLQDRIPFHYQDNMAQFSFDKDGKVLFTCQESENRYLGLAIGPNWFQGPTAFEIYPCNGGYGRLNEDGTCDVMTVTHNGEECTGDDCWLIHSDMLHEAPLCMGMAHDPLASTGTSGFNSIDGRVDGHIVWYHDGVRNKLMRFDFDRLHGTAVIDHRYANIRRYVDVDIKRRPGVPGHMVVDAESRHLYIADPGNKRVLRVNPDSGRFLRGAQCVPDECYPDNTNYTCLDNGAMYTSSGGCAASECQQCSRDLSNKYQCYAGYCRADVCAGEDEFGCYTIYTETGDMFEYELWGCTEYEVFTTQLASPSGIALDGMGRVFISDYDSGVIHAFDKTGAKLASYTAGVGVTGLEFRCADGECTLFFVNALSKEVSMLQVDAPCTGPAPTLPAAPAIAGIQTGYESRTCDATPDRTRPNFIVRHGEGYNNRMVVHHAYGKACEGVAVGEVPAGSTEAEQATCPDRTDCDAINYDLLVMAGFFCHPCLNNPCLNDGVCTNIARDGYTCDCAATGHSGPRCETPPTTCPALAKPAAGALVPPACTSEGQQPGQQCTLMCGSPKMMAYAPAGVATADLVTMCGEDGAWSGGGMACGCIAGHFGEDCETELAALASTSGSVSASGGSVKLANGEGVEVPAGAVAGSVEIMVDEYAYDVADQDTWTARSSVKELRPHGFKFLQPVTVVLSHTEAVDTGSLGIFFYDDVAGRWVEKAGAQAMDGNKVSVETDHFSRWVVMEKAPSSPVVEDDDDDGLGVGAWVGIGVGIVAGLVLLGALVRYLAMPKQETSSDTFKPADTGVPVAQPHVSNGNNHSSLAAGEKPLGPGEHAA